MRCIAEVTVREEKTAKPSFDFNRYMGERAKLIDAALDKSVPMQYPEVINESMRYSLLAGVAASREAASREAACQEENCLLTSVKVVTLEWLAGGKPQLPSCAVCKEPTTLPVA